MANSSQGVTIAELAPVTTLQPSDTFEIDKQGVSYSVTYEVICKHLKESLGINELLDGLAEIIG